MVVLLVGGVLACTGAVDERQLPPDVQDPDALHNTSGALARYQGVLALLPGVFDSLLTTTGILTDELAALPTSVGAGGAYTDMDSRHDLGGFAETYAELHRLRGQAREARGFLQAYAADSLSTALAGHLYALEGLAEIFLADLFCSGIPLSTVDFNDDYTLAAGSSTAEVYEHAVTLLDSAAALTSDSVRLQHFAALDRGRALMALGRYAEAAAAVAGVPDDYAYQVAYTPPKSKGDGSSARMLEEFAHVIFGYGTLLATPSAADGEGGTGLDYRSSGDPRTVATVLGTDRLGNTMYFPAQYPVSGPVTLTVTNSIEARLIEAEAALPNGAAWLSKLNALRTDGTFDTQPNADDPSRTDTLWHAGSGHVAGLRPLADPGSVEGRVDLLFRERAFWLYLTAHRQGDLRRLAREYSRGSDAVYPTGSYLGGDGKYGHEVVAPVPAAEQQLNPKYTGCFNRDP